MSMAGIQRNPEPSTGWAWGAIVLTVMMKVWTLLFPMKSMPAPPGYVVVEVGGYVPMIWEKLQNEFAGSPEQESVAVPE